MIPEEGWVNMKPDWILRWQPIETFNLGEDKPVLVWNGQDHVVARLSTGTWWVDNQYT